MKIIKNLFLLTFAILTVQIANAQSGRMKDPVSFTLKNGLTLVVAENDGADKIFSSFTSEARPGAETSKAGAQEVLNTMLNSKLAKLNNCLTFNDKGGNINADPEVFENALQSLYSAIINPAFNQQDFDAANTEPANSQLTLQDINALYSALMTPSTCVLTIVGDIKTSDAKAMTKKTFGNWKGNPATALSK